MGLWMEDWIRVGEVYWSEEEAGDEVEVEEEGKAVVVDEAV